MTATPVRSRVVCFGEMMIRLTAPGSSLLLQTPSLNVSVGGAEGNVAVSLAQFGHDAALVTVLPDNALGRAAQAEVRKHGVDVTPVIFTKGRMGLYFLTPGAVLRPSEILYDRAHSAFAEAAPDLVDWDKALAGAGWLHVSGVTPAIGPRAAAAAERAMKEAARRGVRISFDGNFRAKLWAEWDGDAPSILRGLLGHAEIAFIDERDIALMLGRSFDAKDPVARKRQAADAAFAAFPSLKRIASTLRVPSSVDHHDLAAVMFLRDAQIEVPAVRLAGIVDRIGGGDAFAAGLLHGVISGREDRAALPFALAAAALKHAIPGDFNLVRESDVDEFLTSGGFDVRR
jgi:2-dehydro-3-deoxygluconokinase